MSFETARAHFEAAQSSTDPAVAHLARGLMDLAKTLEDELYVLRYEVQNLQD
ncbi:MAG TPA: hypothetical protein VFE23_10660 [Usitatibacter sp.]|jgi:hypothetical protein|nr:hypothetical protein [Usitatibacter sp.]